MEGLQVYILVGGCVGDKYNIGVYSTMDLAEKEMKWMIKNDSYYKKYPNDLDIEEQFLNLTIKERIKLSK